MPQFDGKVVLITGGTRGIGLACVRAFATRGATVIWTGRSQRSVDEVRIHMPESAADAGIAADFADPEASSTLVASAASRYGRLDILINNAGIVDAKADPMAASVEEWDRVMAINLRAAFFASRAAAGVMRKAGGGSIVMLGSIAGQIGGAATGPAYVASKAGLEGLTKSLARHFAPFSIRVNCIAPSGIETDMVAAWPPEARARVIAMTPLGRLGHPEEVTQVALYLGGDDSSYVTGQTININGGAYMG